MSQELESQLKLARSRAERFKKARDEAEKLLEQKSRELYHANEELERAHKALEDDVKQATYELSVSNQRLQKALNEKSAFIGQMSHEVRTPLNAILGLSELLLSTDLQGTQFEHVDTIHSAARSLSVLLNDMLDITKIEAGKLQINLEPVDSRRIHKNVITMFELDAQAKGLKLELRVDDAVPTTVRLDKGRYRQIINNLVSNAIKNTEQGSISLDVNYIPGGYSEEIGMLKVQIKDTGVGIPEDRIDSIFNAYEQLGSPSQGVGLGLAICSQLCNLMQGTIWCESRVGEGSVFELVLPAEAIEIDEIKTPDNNHQEGKFEKAPLRILVAEDNVTNQKVLAAQLAQLGQTATMVNNGAEAMLSLQDNEYDLILLDILMPVMDGEQTIAAIRLADSNIATHYCVALTASSFQDQRQRLIDLGFDEFLAKPLSINELSQTLKVAHERASLKLTQPPVGAAGDSNASFDYTYLRSQFGELCETIFIDIAPTFLTHSADDIKMLSEAVSNNNTDAIRKLSHSLKGGSASMGITRLAEQFANLEKRPDASDVHQQFEKIENGWTLIEAQIKQEITRLNGEQ